MRQTYSFCLLFAAVVAASMPLCAQDSGKLLSPAEKAAADIYRLSGSNKMDTAFTKLLLQYPEKDSIDYGMYDNARTYIALVAAGEKKVLLAEKYIQGLRLGVTKGSQYFRLAAAFNRADNVLMAEKYAKLSVDSSAYYAAQNTLVAEGGAAPASVLAASLTLLTGVLEKQGKYEEAIAYISRTIAWCSEKNAFGIKGLQADMLTKAGKPEQAMAIYFQLLKERAGGHTLDARMKVAYAAMHSGRDEGFDTYLIQAKEAVQQAFRDSIRQSHFREKAPLFALRDLKGNLVSLSDYAGKVVILDFWATWCVPCKASFPAMQMTIDKYAGNKDVVFLFIDTWEYTDTPQEQIEHFLTSKNFHFTVLLDAKNAQTGKCEVVEKYKVDGVPAKFIIDKKGFIRFKMKGFGTTNEVAVEELSEMIELAGNN